MIGNSDWLLFYLEFGHIAHAYLAASAMQPMLDVPIYGRIATLELFRPHVSSIFSKALISTTP